MPGLHATSEYLDTIRVFEIQSQRLQSLALFENLVKGYGRPETMDILPLNLDKPRMKSCEILEDYVVEVAQELSICDILSQIAREQRH
jgi:hypothetical protein